MNKLLILYSTIRELTTNSTNYYQLTNYYVDKTKLLFLHGTTTFWCITFHQSVLHLFSKLLLSCYQTTISETEKDYWIIYKQESTFESWQSVFFPAFLFFDEILFLKLTRTAWHGFPFRNCSTAVFAFWRGYIKGVEWLCTLFVRCNTGVILIQSTSTRQPLCARCVLPVGDRVGRTPLGECIIAQFPWLIHHCNQQAFVFEGLGFFELVFDDIPVIY